MAATEHAHRPTDLPGAEPDRDRAVLCDGLILGCVSEIEGGQQGGLWGWSGYWIRADNRVVAESLEDALAEIEKRATPEAIADVKSREC